MRPRCLDLFCGAGGAGMGYYRAGFDVTGVDLHPQPNYPFGFIQGDALEADLSGYDFVHASPPCQGYSRMSGCREGLGDTYPKLIGPIREKLKQWGGPYVIENVVGAPLISPTLLCGPMFSLETYRHRLFESNVSLESPIHPPHEVPASKAGHWQPGTFISVAGNCSPISKAREAMGIDWMTRTELVEAIPPAFTEYLGKQILQRYKFCEKQVAPLHNICNITTDNPNTPPTNMNKLTVALALAFAEGCAVFAKCFKDTFNGPSETPDNPAPVVADVKATTIPKKAPATAKVAEPEPESTPEPEVIKVTADDVLAAMKKAILPGEAAGEAATAILAKYGVKKRSELKPEQYADVIADLNELAANPPKASPLD